MALIKCPECQKDVSSTSKTCIHCGYDLTSLNATTQNEKTQTNTPTTPQRTLNAEIHRYRSVYTSVKLLTSRAFIMSISLILTLGAFICIFGYSFLIVSAVSDPISTVIESKKTIALLGTLGLLFFCVNSIFSCFITTFRDMVIGKTFSAYCFIQKINFVELAKAALSKDVAYMSPAEKKELAKNLYIVKQALAYRNDKNFSKVYLVSLILHLYLFIACYVLTYIFFSTNSNNLFDYIIIHRSINIPGDISSFYWVTYLYLLIIPFGLGIVDMIINVSLISPIGKKANEFLKQSLNEKELSNFSLLPKKVVPIF